MAKHDEQAMASMDAVTTFARFLHVERQLSALLEERLPRDGQMLIAMGGTAT